MKLKIAIIDAALKDRCLLKRQLEKLGVEVRTFYSSGDFGYNANADVFDFVWIDYTINGGAGATAILRALKVKSKTRVVFFSTGSMHLEKSKNYVGDPIVWGLLTKGDKQEITDWVLNRQWEVEHPIEALQLT